MPTDPPLMTSSAIHQATASYYARKLQEFGSSPRGVDWRDERSHRLRHAQFLHLLADSFDGSIGDLGCGYGDFLGFVRERGYRGAYRGYDVATEMLEAARARHGEGDDRRWVQAGEPTETTDFVIASGIFNVKLDCETAAWESYVFETIDRMAAHARRGFAFNVLSLHSDPEYRRPDLYYSDPGQMLNHCGRRYSRRLACLQDYGLYEFTLIVRKD
jgi:SAM-dependent methyltransferase